MISRGTGKHGVGAALCAVVAVALLAGSTSANGRAPIRVDIATIPVDAASLAFYAKHKGFFRRQGIDANIVLVSDPSQVTAAVLSGSADFAANSMGGFAILKSRGAPVRMVAAGAMYRPKAPTTVLMAGKGQRIRRARDLIGKTVAIDAPNAITHVAMMRWLKRNGVSASRVEFRTLAFADMLGPLARGTIHAAVLPEPFITLARRQGATRIAKIFDSVCPRTCLYTGWAARTDVDPNLAARFRRAIQAAAVWADQKKNRGASGRILARYAPIDAAVLRRMTRVYFAKRLVPSMAQPWINAYAEFGVIPARFPARDLVK